MTKVLIVLLLALVLEAVGVVFLSRGLKQIGEPEKVSVVQVWRAGWRGAGHPPIPPGVAPGTIFFCAPLSPLFAPHGSFILPLTGPGFVLAALGARVLPDEGNP